MRFHPEAIDKEILGGAGTIGEGERKVVTQNAVLVGIIQDSGELHEFAVDN